MRPLAILAALALAALVPVGAVYAPPHSTAALRAGTPYTVLQMNLCLSGTADCYSRTGHDAVLDEAAEQIRDHDPAAVTLNEACSADAGDLARRAGYRMRFAAVRVAGAALPCVAPVHRGVFGLAVLTRNGVETSRDRAFATHTGAEARRWLCVTTSRATACTAHLGTRGSTAERRANDDECAELRGVLARYDAAGTTVFGGDVNRRTSCARPACGRRATPRPSSCRGSSRSTGAGRSGTTGQRVAPATHTDHDFLSVASRL